MANSDTNTISTENVAKLIDLVSKYKKIPSPKYGTFDLSVHNGLSKAMFERSPQAWLVYAAACARVQTARTFQKKKDYQQILNTLNGSNVDLFVRLIDQQMVSHNQRAQIQKLVEQAQKERGKRLDTASENQDDSNQDSGDEFASEHEEVYSGNDEIDVDLRPIPGASPRRNQGINPGTNDEMQWRKFVNASLDATVSLFPQFLGDAIQRLPHSSETDMMVAAVDLFIPSRDELYSLGCIMGIRVHGSAVFQLARDLFGVNVEQDAIGTYVACSGGVKIRPQDSLKLDGCSMDAISTTVFGIQTYQAIRSSDTYQDALRNRHSKTTAVTMTIDGLRATSGSLLLSLGVVDAGFIRLRLYET